MGTTIISRASLDMMREDMLSIEKSSFAQASQNYTRYTHYRNSSPGNSIPSSHQKDAEQCFLDGSWMMFSSSVLYIIFIYILSGVAMPQKKSLDRDFGLGTVSKIERFGTSPIFLLTCN